MYRNYYPYAPTCVYSTYPYSTRRCFHHPQMYQHPLPNPYNVSDSHEQQGNQFNHSYFQNPPEPISNQNGNPNQVITTQVNTDGNNPGAFSHQFLNENGQVDVNKMLSTVGQLAQTVQQVSPVIKQVNDIIQSFRE